MGLFQRQIPALVSISSLSPFFNVLWMHKGIFWCLRVLLEIPFLIPPKYFGLLCFSGGKLKDNVGVFFATDIP